MSKNALTTHDGTPPVDRKEPISAGGKLAALVPQNVDQAFRLANALAQAGDMVPKHFQGKPQATMAAIVRGMEIGLSPMQSLSSIAVINGRAALWGDALPALMQRAGHHVDVEIEGEGDRLVAVATLTRGDNGKVIVRRFSMADAKRAGLAGKQGPWQQYPARMLSHRARSWAIRDGAADALMGMQVADEVSDYQGPDHARDVTPRAPSRGGALYLDEPDEDESVVDEIHEADPPADEEEPAEAEILDPEVSEPPADAVAEAGRGTEHFRAWWKDLTRERRADLKPHLPRLQEIAAKADEANEPADGLDATAALILDRLAAAAGVDEADDILNDPSLDEIEDSLPARYAEIMAAAEEARGRLPL